jgi:Asparagine synthase
MNPASPAARPWALAPNPLGLTELDVASGIVLGTNEPPHWPGVERDPLDVLFDEARELLQRGRCVVAFSGGRDSSAVLAALLHVARRDGFDEPVAVTARWPGDAAADESAWQEHVARELRVKHWEVISPGTDFDLLGPLATRLLRNHGLFWPAPTAALMPMIEAAGDGVLVTGQGGDQVFGTWSTAGAWARARYLGNLHHLRTVASSLRPLLAATLPRSVRLRRAISRAQPYQSWLTPEARDAQREAWGSEMVAIAPLWWPDYLHEVGSERGLRLAGQTQSALCEARGGSFATPLLSPAFLAALARRGGRLGLGERTAAMMAVFSPVLSEAVLSRRSKATFGDVFWGPESRSFASDWDGDSLDGRWVDAEALRAAWRQPRPVYGAALPLQAAWLAREERTTGAATPGGLLPL